ncbi:hypothetical protein FB567DRAFT_16028 [Paraphoma chrysanthemicola]|uniref:Uncharacterized protein n=1 Tax=Paraphoma chrysanthemicola TaxID=798071 RepID=A0A8K0W582_9PLEO|nr:hypothetical protein FB567DRAFT_16028 [Paraphoma chrysanthemicola]
MRAFDKSSGIVYTEHVSTPVRSMVPTWMSQARGGRDQKSTLKSRGKGCSGLQEMALRSCAWNAELFMPETLQWAGWHFAEMIYKHLLNTDALTYNAWNVFYDAFPDELNPQHEFHVYQQDERSTVPTQLPSITGRLTRLDTNLITFLCIRDFSLTFDHLKTLISIRTLAGLVLEQSRRGGTSDLSARNFTDWCRAVKERDALRQLRLLIMCDFGIGRKTVLPSVTDFPSLRLVGLQNSKTWIMSDEPPREYGAWQLMTPSGLEQRGLSHTSFDPQSIWGASYLTSSTKVQQLHTLTDVLKPPPSEKPEISRSICITYGGWANRSIYEATSWFIRSQQLPEQKPHAPLVQEVIKSAGAEGANKKRKVRSGKRLDVGSLLGAFT